MEQVLKYGKAHWKKLVFASVPVAFGTNYVTTEYQVSQQMRHICKVVSQYSITNNNVLVVLNPVANKKKCEKNFTKYFEPALHMAGYAVDVVKTKHIGHAKSLMEELEHLPDVIVVAGGDGTSSEVVTGLIRRKQEMCPILFLPLGEKNETARGLMRIQEEESSEIVKNLNRCVLALVQGQIQNHPLIKYELIDEGHSEVNKPTFGIQGFSWGVIKDIEMNKDNYWYFGKFRYFASAFFASLSNKLCENINTTIKHTPPCPGCKKCEHVAEKKSWLNISNLLSPRLPSQPALQLKEHEQCSTETSCNLLAKQIDIRCTQSSEAFLALKTDIIEDIESKYDFLLNLISKNKTQPTISLESRTLEVIPSQTEPQTFYIDGEGYDARHIKISFLPNALKYFSLAKDLA